MASNTEHLNLLKKDPVADGNEYFNIETMLNENWDKIDEAVGDVQNRLNRSSIESITLQPGLQTINAKRDARFKLGELRGRTMINLLGNRGGCETVVEWFSPNGNLSTDTATKDSGLSSLKYVNKGVTQSAYARSSLFTIDPTKHLLIISWVKNNNHSTFVRLVDPSGVNIPSTLAAGVYANETGIAFRALTPAELQGKTSVCVDVYSNEAFASGSSFNFDSFRAYAITSEEYAALRGLTPKEVGDKYPFVPSGIVGVENPYAMAASGNMLPPFYEWRALSVATGATYTIDSPYKMTLNDPGQQVGEVSLFFKLINVPKNTDITLTLPHEVWNTISDATGDNLLYPWEKSKGQTINTGNNTQLRVYLGNRDGAGSYVFENPMLMPGTEPKPFEPQRSSLLAWQTELHANPVDGSDPDELFEQDGQNYKLEKWKKIVVTGDLSGVKYEAPQSYTGYKRIRLRYIGPTPLTSPSFIASATKYNGNQLMRMGQFTGADSYAVGADSGNYLLLHISNADSGWGDNYTPVDEGEIKAYFNGWRMAANDNWGLPYPGTGIKAWGRIDQNGNLIAGSGTTTLPTTINTEGGYTPYQLLYRLAKEIVEPVTTEGCFTLSECDNTVEVGTGIVLRERANPVFGLTSYGINNAGSAGQLKNKTADILRIYRDSKPDYAWAVLRDSAPYGIARAVLSPEYYDQSAAYSVTYTKLDASPILPITGSLAANEKAQLSDLTAGVAEALHGISVLTMQKAEKDAPGWITPTLLNGWVNYGQSFETVGYFKDSMGVVHLKGLVKSGATTAPTDIFYLPVGYRPNLLKLFVCSSSDGTNVITARVDVSSTGAVRISAGGNGWLSFETISFLAEK